MPKDLEDTAVDPETFKGFVSEDTSKLFQKYEKYGDKDAIYVFCFQ